MVHIDETNELIYAHDSGAERQFLIAISIFTTPIPRPSRLGGGPQQWGIASLLSIGDLFASNIGGKFGELQRTRVLSGVFMGLEIWLKASSSSGFRPADLDNDGMEEFLVSTRGLYWRFFSVPKNVDTEEFMDDLILSQQPGIVKGGP